MGEDSKIMPTKNPRALSQEIGAQAKRKIRARRNVQNAWIGLGMVGLIGWSIVVPTLLGAALGIWLDHHHHSKYSWTLMSLIIGLVIGCAIAWHWVAKEDREMREAQNDDD